jgi:hypothetical protein
MSAHADPTVDHADSDRGHGPLERVTVNLTPRSSRALRETAELTGDTKTDTINRAMHIYAFLEGVWNSGGSVYLRRSPDAAPELLRAF